MSLITRCPACSTVFKVVADQLKVSGGWVRCGHCSEVFDAQTALLAGGVAAVAPVPVSASEAEPPPVSMPTPSVVSKNAAAEESSLAVATASEAVVFVAAPDAPMDSALEASPKDSVVPASGYSSENFDSSFFERPTPPPDVSFVRQAQRQAFWRRPLLRAAMGVICLALLCLLAVQVAVFERDRIAAMEPRAKPWLLALCEPLGCTLAPLRQSEALLIESSTFNKLRPDVYRLSVTIKNNGLLELAMPSLDLALTDSQDQAIVRRVITPTELRAAATLAARGEFNGVVNVQIDKAALTGSANTFAGSIAGFRVAAFYP